MEMQLLGWADGSRLWLMGDDEADFDDEDENGNTPGFLAAGVLGGHKVALPYWPNPVDGATRLRQTNCKADLDGSPQYGWTVMHSHLGEIQVPAGFLSKLPAYTASPLIFWQHCPAGSLEWEDKLATSPTGPIPLPPLEPHPVDPPKPPRRRRWWERIFG